MREYDHEPVRGLPEELPAGERILWQGSPQASRLASTVFHWRAVAVYFAVVMAWQALAITADGGGAAQAAGVVLVLTACALAVLGLIALAAKVFARTTVYTITNQRIVMRIGAALPKAINIPFAIVSSADLRAHPGGDGDIALSLKGTGRIAYLQLWPHARPWTFNPAQPMLRAIPDAEAVADTLARALRGEPVPHAAITTAEAGSAIGAGQPAPAAA